MKMVVGMISGNITILYHPAHVVGNMFWWWGIVMFPEIVVTTICIVSSLHELKFQFFWSPAISSTSCLAASDFFSACAFCLSYVFVFPGFVAFGAMVTSVGNSNLP
jgi:hypothetical protein